MSALEQPATTLVEPVKFHSAPKPLPSKLPPVPKFDPALCPDSLRDWIMDQADALQVPAEFCAVPAISALGGVIGRQLGIRVKQRENWIEYPILWAAVIGRPSAGKSPALRPVTGFLSRLEAEGAEDYDEALREYEIESLLQKQAAKLAEKRAATALSKGDTETARCHLETAQHDIEAPTRQRLEVNEPTIESLGEILNQNPRGLIQRRDELSGWLASLDKDGREMDRAFWLECWNGHGPFTVDRIVRGTVRIEAPAVTVLGGIQPGKLEQYVKGAVKGGFGDDGLIQRFQMAVYPDVPESWKYVDRAPSPESEARAWQTYCRLFRIDHRLVGAEDADPPFLRFSADAQTLFIEWYTELMLRLRQGNEPPFIESHLAKYPALAARLALVLHMADHEQGPVSGEALAKALDWCEFLEHHARRIYAPAADKGITASHLISAKREKLPDGFSARDVYRKGWSGLDRVETVADGLNVLVEYGHLHEWEDESRTKPAIRYSWVV